MIVQCTCDFGPCPKYDAKAHYDGGHLEMAACRLMKFYCLTLLLCRFCNQNE